ncbi:MAG: hypothetical protein MHM6MM_002284 [Cercozoa sp. M6MM]
MTKHLMQPLVQMRSPLVFDLFAFDFSNKHATGVRDPFVQQQQEQLYVVSVDDVVRTVIELPKQVPNMLAEMHSLRVALLSLLARTWIGEKRNELTAPILAIGLQILTYGCDKELPQHVAQVVAHTTLGHLHDCFKRAHLLKQHADSMQLQFSLQQLRALDSIIDTLTTKFPVTDKLVVAQFFVWLASFALLIRDETHDPRVAREFLPHFGECALPLQIALASFLFEHRRCFESGLWYHGSVEVLTSALKHFLTLPLSSLQVEDLALAFRACGLLLQLAATYSGSPKTVAEVPRIVLQLYSMARDRQEWLLAPGKHFGSFAAAIVWK